MVPTPSIVLIQKKGTVNGIEGQLGYLHLGHLSTTHLQSFLSSTILVLHLGHNVMVPTPNTVLSSSFLGRHKNYILMDGCHRLGKWLIENLNLE